MVKCLPFLVSLLLSVNADASIRLPLFSRQLNNGTATGNNTHPMAVNNGSSPLALSTDKQSYYTVIRAGEINFRVSIDTGSADLWLLSTQCTSNSCNHLPRYPLAYQSPSFQAVENNSTSFSVSYADGTGANGFVARENFTLANLTLSGQAFGMVTESNVSLTDLSSGVLGLGFPRLSTISTKAVNGTPFFSRLAAQGLLAYPLFGISATTDGQGSLTFGAIDTAVVKNVSQISWHDVVEFPPFGSEANSSSYLHWALPLSSFSAGGTVITPQPTYDTASKASLALFDIGTSGIYGPHQDVERLFAAIDSARRVAEGQWAVPCDFTGSITFVFGNQNYTLQPTDYMIGPTEGNPNFCLSWPVATKPSADGIDWQLGSPFLRTVYSAYSYGINGKESPKIGLYRLSNSTVPETTESIESFFATASATVHTTLPNAVLLSETYTTPSYTFNSSFVAPTGGIVSSALATSTYSPILKGTHYNASALPTISPVPSIYTLILTNSIGVVETSTSTRVVPSVTLGVPPGWSGSQRTHAPSLLLTAVVPCIVSYTALLLTRNH